MKRREILKYTAYVTGAALSAPLISSILSGCQSEAASTAADSALTFFSGKEFKQLKAIVDAILPKTDSPSATEVGVHQMIDTMVGTVYRGDDQKKYKEGFDVLLQHLGNFASLKSEKQLEVLSALSRSESNETNDARDALLDIKQQTVAYYLTTEEIGKNYLNYLPVPGDYEACISLESVGGKAWAL
ncbi:MAG: gluconate 2-dehydrogenase subunit 3 family protein [Chitinophagales bacterium]|nr:gluconate 2-dehydrogenase subunit 3 family protein [Chitinophagales bacterium]